MLLLVGSEKGGTGKTTIAVNLAVYRALQGKEVLLVDTDPQGSASIWSLVRSESLVAPTITCVSLTGKVGYDLTKLKPKFDTIIVDAGGRDSIEMRQAAVVCDKMIIPVRPSQFDTWTMIPMVKILNELQEKTGEKVNAHMMLNAVSTNPQVREAEDTLGLLAEYSDQYPTLASMLCDRIAYRRSPRDGISVHELKGQNADPKACFEVAALYKEVFNGY